MPTSRREADLQQAILDQLAIHGWRAEAFAKPGTHRKLGGVMPTGWPDVVALKPKRTKLFVTGRTSPAAWCKCLLIEVKTPTGVLSDTQQEYHRTLATWGIPVHIVRSVEELWTLLEAAGEQVKVVR